MYLCSVKLKIIIVSVIEKKYKLTKENIDFFGRTLYHIEALKDFDDVKKGDMGGYVQSENNLSQEGNCWIYDNAVVYDNAQVCGNARVCDNAWVYDNANVCGNARVFGSARVYDNARVFGNAQVCDNARIVGNARVFGSAVVCGNAEIKNNTDYIVFKNWWSSGRYFTWTRSNNMWGVGCFYGTGEELIKKAYKDSEISGREYERVVNYVESMLRDTE